VVAEALALVDKTAERVHEAELYRLKGELTLQSKARSSRSEAEGCFHRRSMTNLLENSTPRTCKKRKHY
jgi:hypothetical protein